MKNLINNLLDWYILNKRDFPWRSNAYYDVQTWAYHTWVCEVMSQQTLLSVVLPKFNQFILQLPTVADLAHCPEELLRSLWSGLGYYARARNLKKGAQFILENYNGLFPASKEEWLKVPGCGEYTSSIIASICFSQTVPAIDGNVIRVASRLLGLQAQVWEKQGQQKIQQFLENLMSEFFVEKEKNSTAEKNSFRNAGNINQAFMELGATVCKKQSPLCSDCPVSNFCQAFKNNIVELCPPIKPRKEVQAENIYVLVFMNKENNSYLLFQREKGFLAKTSGFALLAKKSLHLWDGFVEAANYQGFGVKTLSKTFNHQITHHKITGYVTLIEINSIAHLSHQFCQTFGLPVTTAWVSNADLKNHLSSSLDHKALKLLNSIV